MNGGNLISPRHFICDANLEAKENYSQDIPNPHAKDAKCAKKTETS
jgi:hypothetical protein